MKGGRRWPRVLLGAGIALGLLVALLVFRARTEVPGPLKPGVAVDVRAEELLERFSRALRFETVSHGPDSGIAPDPQKFEAFLAFVRELYPRVHATLEVERVGQAGVLYTWPGRDPHLEPVLLMGHFDVVPVDGSTLDSWTHPPFDGVISDGLVWGRGSFDNKVNVMGLLEGAEALLVRGFSPARTTYSVPTKSSAGATVRPA
jgi:carboxypeptidase PM20D1